MIHSAHFYYPSEYRGTLVNLIDFLLDHLQLIQLQSPICNQSNVHSKFLISYQPLGELLFPQRHHVRPHNDGELDDQDGRPSAATDKPAFGKSA